MRTSRRLQRLTRHRPKLQAINLTSLMDVFTILVFFLLVNSGSELIQAPKQLVLPESKIESLPRETVVIYIDKDDVVVQGERVARVADLLATDSEDIEPLRAHLQSLQDRVIGVRTQVVAQSKEVTILADKSVPFRVVKQVMSSCTAQGYERISLAVTQRAPSTTQI